MGFREVVREVFGVVSDVKTPIGFGQFKKEMVRMNPGLFKEVLGRAVEGVLRDRVARAGGVVGELEGVEVGELGGLEVGKDEVKNKGKEKAEIKSTVEEKVLVVA